MALSGGRHKPCLSWKLGGPMKGSLTVRLSLRLITSRRVRSSANFWFSVLTLSAQAFRGPFVSGLGSGPGVLVFSKISLQIHFLLAFLLGLTIFFAI